MLKHSFWFLAFVLLAACSPATELARESDNASPQANAAGDPSAPENTAGELPELEQPPAESESDDISLEEPALEPATPPPEAFTQPTDQPPINDESIELADQPAPPPDATSSTPSIPIAESPVTNRRVGVDETYPKFPQLLPFDGIRPVYDPEFVSAAEAPLKEDELVMGIAWGNEAKAYPVSVLRFREMVNDELGGIPTLVTW